MLPSVSVTLPPCWTRPSLGCLACCGGQPSAVSQWRIYRPGRKRTTPKQVAIPADNATAHCRRCHWYHCCCCCRRPRRRQWFRLLPAAACCQREAGVQGHVPRCPPWRLPVGGELQATPPAHTVLSYRTCWCHSTCNRRQEAGLTPAPHHNAGGRRSARPWLVMSPRARWCR